VAICGLPPLNGFVSEFLIYLGFFRGIQGTGIAAAATALAAPALAMVGGLAVACFVKVYGIVFLGVPRSDEHIARHEAGWQMLLPMTLLALLCAAIGLAPALFENLLQQASLAALPVIMASGASPLGELVPLSLLTVMGVGLVVVLGALFLWYRQRLAAAPVEETATWGCGYQRPLPRMQYSASSFAQMLTGLFGFVLKPRTHRPLLEGIFPRRSAFHSHVPEAVLELVYIPALKRLYDRTVPIRKLQSGILQQYVLYTLITLIVLLLSDYL
jgi:NADH:ubiquinone oxidoreductase subunit 5 (subunit L)/multisubunit Na+/H+ antiporter MnhA subunit